MSSVRPFAPYADAEPEAFRLPIELFGQITPTVEGRWLVKHLLRASAATVVFGIPGCGKSFIVLDFGLHVSAGKDWFGRRVSKGAVVYIAAEGQGGVRARIEAWKREHGIYEDIPFAIVTAPVDLFDPSAGDIAKLNSDLARLRELWGRIDLVIVDTLNATMGAGDENGPDMGVYVGNVRRLCGPVDCGWIIVTHVPVNGDARRPRGHGSLWGAVDTAIQVSGDRYARKLSIVKQKDDDPGPDILFRLKQVPIGIDEDGDDITSCIVEPSELEPSVGRRKLSAKEQIVLTALERALIANGIIPPHEIPNVPLSVGKVVQMSGWRSEAYTQLGAPDINSDTLSKAFRRAKEALQASKIIGVWGDFVWIT